MVGNGCRPWTQAEWSHDVADSPLDIYDIARRIADPAERVAYLERACAGDEAVRERIVAMLRVEDVPGSFLDSPIVRGFSTDETGNSVPRGPGVGAHDPDDRIGQVLSERYRIVARIGSGGMGVVYRAWDKLTDGYVVVKSPKSRLGGDAMILGRFRLELAALQKLSHPGIVPIIDVGSVGMLPFAVMPYLAGGSLKQRRRFRDDRPLVVQPTELWHWLPAIARALEFVHASGYVHRDVKPDNILFDGRGTPFLGDFGLAKIVLAEDEQSTARGLTKTGLAVGTPHYMAPEVILHSAVSPQADQFALAVLLYELLAARKPFDGLTPSAVLVANASTEPPSLREHAPQLDARIIDAIGRGMAKDPAARFPGCVAFVDALLAAVPQLKPQKRFRLMCPSCSKLLTVFSKLAGKPGACPKCGVNLKIGHDLLSLWLREDRKNANEPLGAVWIGGQGLDEDTPPHPGAADTPLPAGPLAPRSAGNDFFRELREVVAKSTPIKVAIALAVTLAVTLVIALGTD
jgi:serine/threonine protein kinase